MPVLDRRIGAGKRCLASKSQPIPRKRSRLRAYPGYDGRMRESHHRASPVEIGTRVGLARVVLMARRWLTRCWLTRCWLGCWVIGCSVVTSCSDRHDTGVATTPAESPDDSKPRPVRGSAAAKVTSQDANQPASPLRAFERHSHGLLPKRLPNGAVKLPLDRRFMYGVVARQSPDGRIERGCVDSVSAAQHWLPTVPAPPP